MSLFTITDNGHLSYSDIESVLKHKEIAGITATAETGMYLIDGETNIEPGIIWNYKLDGSWQLGILPFGTGSNKIPYQGFVSKGVSNTDGSFSRTWNYVLDGSWNLGTTPFATGWDEVIVTVNAIDCAYTIMGLTIDFDIFNNDYPADFDIDFCDVITVWAYKLDGTWRLGALPFITKQFVLIEKAEIAGNDNVHFKLDKKVENVKQIILTFKKTFNFDRRIRITDLSLIISTR